MTDSLSIAVYAFVSHVISDDLILGWWNAASEGGGLVNKFQRTAI